jgi:dipeptidyl aminopeptidase/acylaminoacyl peptidase
MLMRKRAIWLPVLLFVMSVAARAAGQATAPAERSRERLLNEATAARGFRDVALAPDGRRVAWVESATGRRSASTIHVADLAEEKGKQAANGSQFMRIPVDSPPGAHDHSPAWSADSKRIAFLSNRARAGQFQIYCTDAAGGSPRKLTDLKGALAQPRWSPDGKHIAFLFIENATRAAGPIAAVPAEVGEIGRRADEQRLCTVEVESGHVEMLSPADHYVYEYDWAPDSQSFALIAAQGDGDNNWYIARLYTLPLRSHELHLVYKPAIQIAVPRWSPDGRQIAFIGGLMSDEGVVGGEIYTINASGGSPRNRTPGLKTSASWLAWLSPGRILFTEWSNGGSGLAALDPETGAVESLWTGAESVTGEGGVFGVSPARDGKTCALVRQSFQDPPEVWAGPIGAWRQITHANARLRPTWGKAESLHWKSDEWMVQGWLVHPAHVEPGRRYPMIVSVHGGPAAARRPAWPGTTDLIHLAGEGYFVFFPNPRGSYGQGERFTQANVRYFGHGDLRDILAGVDAVVRTRPVDGERLGLTGWSYGGFMTMWAVTQTKRFRAAVAGAGIANWQSYYGQNGIDQWMIPYFGASVYDDPAVYARSSPITYIKNVKTPTLVLVGEHDVECPPPQSYEFWHALRTLGVPTTLVVYPNEGHGIGKPEHRRDILSRTAAWFDRYLAVDRR